MSGSSNRWEQIELDMLMNQPFSQYPRNTILSTVGSADSTGSPSVSTRALDSVLMAIITPDGSDQLVNG